MGCDVVADPAALSTRRSIVDIEQVPRALILARVDQVAPVSHVSTYQRDAGVEKATAHVALPRFIDLPREGHVIVEIVKNLSGRMDLGNNDVRDLRKYLGDVLPANIAPP
jgi:hypothetical protein